MTAGRAVASPFRSSNMRESQAGHFHCMMRTGLPRGKRSETGSTGRIRPSRYQGRIVSSAQSGGLVDHLMPPRSVGFRTERIGVATRVVTQKGYSEGQEQYDEEAR